MSGYEVEQQTARLTFNDMPGLEVRTTIPPLGDLLDMLELADKGTADAAGVKRLFASFAQHLIEWNVTQAGKPVPATAAGLHRLPVRFAISLIRKWVEGMADVDPTSPAASPDGEMPAGIPVDPLPDR